MGLDNLPNHCESNHCRWCAERRERRRRQAIAAQLSAVGPAVSPWETRTSDARDPLGYWSYASAPPVTPPLAWGGRGIKYLHEPADRTGHRRARS